MHIVRCASSCNAECRYRCAYALDISVHAWESISRLLGGKSDVSLDRWWMTQAFLKYKGDYFIVPKWNRNLLGRFVKLLNVLHLLMLVYLLSSVDIRQCQWGLLFRLLMSEGIAVMCVMWIYGHQYQNVTDNSFLTVEDRYYRSGRPSPLNNLWITITVTYSIVSKLGQIANEYYLQISNS